MNKREHARGRTQEEEKRQERKAVMQQCEERRGNSWEMNNSVAT